MKTPKGFFTYFHHAQVLDNLTDEQAGRVYKALLHYGDEGVLPDFCDDAVCRLAFTMIRIEVDRNFERYREVCEKRQAIAKKREERKRAEQHRMIDEQDGFDDDTER